MPPESPQQHKPNIFESQLDILSPPASLREAFRAGRIDLNDLKPEVRPYLQNLITQAQGILKTYNRKLETAPIEDLQLLKALINKLLWVDHNKEVHPEDKDRELVNTWRCSECGWAYGNKYPCGCWFMGCDDHTPVQYLCPQHKTGEPPSQGGTRVENR